MRTKRGVAAAICLAATIGCYHQVVQTGLSPGTTVISKPWTATWLWGLVPAGAIDVTQQCASGIATVETQMSFMNGLVGVLTLGIYTPRDVKVTCASGTASVSGMSQIQVAGNARAEERQVAFERAIAEATLTGKPVAVNFQGSEPEREERQQ
jgi:hypothetical protein